MAEGASKITPRNLSAQLAYRGRGNPPVSHPSSAISNCFPGLEFDFRGIWRRFLVGIVLSENNNYVVGYEDEQFKDLVGRRLLKINERPLSVVTQGPVLPGRGSTTLSTGGSPDAVSFMEWSNTVALLVRYQGQKVRCLFTLETSENEVLPDNPDVKTQVKELEVRQFFERVESNGVLQLLPVLAEAMAQPGEPPGPLLALAERLPRMRLLLLGGQPPRLRQCRAGRRRNRAAATIGCSARTREPTSSTMTISSRASATMTSSDPGNPF